MKSPMIDSANNISAQEKELYGHMHVMVSPAGFYIGTLYWDNEKKMFDAGSRDTDYFLTYKQADDYLDSAMKAIASGEDWRNFFREEP